MAALSQFCLPENLGLRFMGLYRYFRLGLD